MSETDKISLKLWNTRGRRKKIVEIQSYETYFAFKKR